MKTFATILLALLLLIANGCVQTPYETARKANLEIAQSTIAGGGHCSATAIGPHAILTATHCEQTTDVINIRGIEKPANILGRVRDSFDHSILYVDATFEDYATVLTGAPLTPGTDVFVWGSPSNWYQLLRKGYIAGIDRDNGALSFFNISRPDIYLFDFQAYPGDSGAAIYNNDGQIVAVISMVADREIHAPNGYTVRIQLTCAFAFGFTAETWESARKWSSRTALAAPLEKGGQ